MIIVSTLVQDLNLTKKKVKEIKRKNIVPVVEAVAVVHNNHQNNQKNIKKIKKNMKRSKLHQTVHNNNDHPEFFIIHINKYNL